MKRSNRIAAVAAASLALGLATAAYAHLGQTGSGMESCMQGGMQHDMKESRQHGMAGGMGHDAMGQGAAGQFSGHQLMTPEERTALMEKMRNAKTPEEHQKIATATHAEMQKRAREKGITVHEHAPRPDAAPQAPATTEHAH